jgi:hypothetical protein
LHGIVVGNTSDRHEYCPCKKHHSDERFKPQPAFFEEHEIRRVYDESTETWWFSVVDIVQVLTQQADY